MRADQHRRHRRDSGRRRTAVTQVADLTGSPEILDGRVKTLHPTVHGGILARRDLASHQAELDSQGIGTIDAVVGNLYPFVETVNADGVTLQDALENIDIGGPTMIRAAAKNFPFVLVLVDPGDYGWVSERIAEHGLTAAAFSLEERRELARKAFQHVALYDTAVARYLTGETEGTSWPELTLATIALPTSATARTRTRRRLYTPPLCPPGA